MRLLTIAPANNTRSWITAGCSSAPLIYARPQDCLKLLTLMIGHILLWDR
jgi:hypothetical protein